MTTGCCCFHRLLNTPLGLTLLDFNFEDDSCKSWKEFASFIQKGFFFLRNFTVLGRLRDRLGMQIEGCDTCGHKSQDEDESWISGLLRRRRKSLAIVQNASGKLVHLATDGVLKM